MKKSKILITGKPGIGKTTLIKNLMKNLENTKVKGFYTEEIRTGGKRTGFKIVGISSQDEKLLAHINFKNTYRISKYGVDVEVLDKIVEKEFSEPYPDLFVLDEIGPMECLSSLFKETVIQLLESTVPVLGTIKEKGDRFISEIKSHPAVEVYTLTVENRNYMLKTIMKRLKDVLEQK